MIHKLRIILTNVTVEWFIWKIIPRILPVLSYSHAVVVSQAVISQALRLPDTPVVIVPEASIRPLKLPGHSLPSNQHYVAGLKEADHEQLFILGWDRGQVPGGVRGGVSLAHGPGSLPGLGLFIQLVTTFFVKVPLIFASFDKDRTAYSWKNKKLIFWK